MVIELVRPVALHHASELGLQLLIAVPINIPSAVIRRLPEEVVVDPAIDMGMRDHARNVAVHPFVADPLPEPEILRGKHIPGFSIGCPARPQPRGPRRGRGAKWARRCRCRICRHGVGHHFRSPRSRQRGRSPFYSGGPYQYPLDLMADRPQHKATAR